MDPSPDPDALIITVARTGGIAGLRREWRAVPPPSERDRWHTLIDACGWDADIPSARGADRFWWRVEVDDGPARRRSPELPDGHLDDGWRGLIDAVREWRPSEE